MTNLEIAIEKKRLRLRMCLDKRDRLTRQINKAERIKAAVEENLKIIGSIFL
jgi:hypothetical protein